MRLWKTLRSKRVSKSFRTEAKRKTLLRVDGLEEKKLMAMTAVLNPTTHILTITGSTGNDNVSVWNPLIPTVSKTGPAQATPDQSTICVKILNDTGYEVDASFKSSNVTSIVYDGKSGNDVFNNKTSVTSKTTIASGGLVNTSTLIGSTAMLDPTVLTNQGKFLVGPTGQVSVDYLYDGAGNRGQLGIYSLAGMDAFTPGTAAYNKEAARRILSNSTLGHVVISVQTETAKYDAKMSWESDYYSGHGTYLGPKTYSMNPGDEFATMLVPNGLVQDVYNTPSTTDATKTPLYSIPDANPYKATSQLRGQMGDLNGNGNLFAFEDLSLAGASDRDYNDMVFSVAGARGCAVNVSSYINPSKNFLKTDVFSSIGKTSESERSSDHFEIGTNTNDGHGNSGDGEGGDNGGSGSDSGTGSGSGSGTSTGGSGGTTISSNATTNYGTYRSGVFTVGQSGNVTVDYLYDGGGYQSEIAIFSLQGMGSYTPGSAAFIQEATRRALSDSVLGHIVISSHTEGARTSSALPWEVNYNSGTYLGVKSFAMNAGDKFAVMLIPAGTVWELYNNPTLGTKKTPLFSIPEANPKAYDQMADYTGTGTTLGFEDERRDGVSDQDYNDKVFRIGGASTTAPSVDKLAAPGKDMNKVAAAKTILA